MLRFPSAFYSRGMLEPEDITYVVHFSHISDARNNTSFGGKKIITVSVIKNMRRHSWVNMAWHALGCFR